MNRTDLQQLANERLRDAQTLLDAGQWSGAYYLAGYAVEFALKACVAKLTNQHDYPDKEFAQKCYTHKIETLVAAAGVKVDRDRDAKTDPVLGANWLTVKDWNEEARYQQWSEPQARVLLSAVADPTHGVLIWIKGRW